MGLGGGSGFEGTDMGLRSVRIGMGKAELGIWEVSGQWVPQPP